MIVTSRRRHPFPHSRRSLGARSWAASLGSLFAAGLTLALLAAGEPQRPRYKVTIQGRQGDSGVLWHYYLIANPDGDQLIATFTLGLAQQAQFADQDLRLIGSLEWK